MDKELIRRLARDLGPPGPADPDMRMYGLTEWELKRFAARVAEECAKIVLEEMPPHQEWMELQAAAIKIRARFTTP